MRVFIILYTLFLVGLGHCGDPSLQGSSGTVRPRGVPSSTRGSPTAKGQSQVQAQVPPAKKGGQQATGAHAVKPAPKEATEQAPPKEEQLSAKSDQNATEPTKKEQKLSDDNSVQEAPKDVAGSQGENPEEQSTKGASPKNLTASQSTPVTLDIAKPDESKIQIVISDNGGVNCKRYLAKDGYDIGSVVFSGQVLWDAPEGSICASVTVTAKGDVTLLGLWVGGGTPMEMRGFEKLDGEWKELPRDDYFEKEKKMRGIHTDSVNEAKKPTLLSPFALNVDPFMFDLEEGEEDGVPIFKIKAKVGVKTQWLTYGGLTVWEGKDPGDSCSSAIIYLDEDRVYLAVLDIKNAKKKVAKVYKYCKSKNNLNTLYGVKQVKGWRDGDVQWKDSNENDHKKKLNKLKKNRKLLENITLPTS